MRVSGKWSRELLKLEWREKERWVREGGKRRMGWVKLTFSFKNWREEGKLLTLWLNSLPKVNFKREEGRRLSTILLKNSPNLSSVREGGKREGERKMVQLSLRWREEREGGRGSEIKKEPRSLTKEEEEEGMEERDSTMTFLGVTVVMLRSKGSLQLITR